PDLLLALGQGVVREDGGYLPAPAFRVRRATRPPDRAACDGPRRRDRPDGSAKYAAGSTSPASPKRGACRGARRRGGRALNASRSDSAPIPETKDVGDVMAAERLPACLRRPPGEELPRDAVHAQRASWRSADDARG